MPASSDLSAWARREDERARRAGAIVARVESHIDAARAVLRAHGVAEAYLFGSVARGEPRAESDVDIAVAGCPPQRFYRLAAELERVFDMALDLLDLDAAPADRAAAIRAEGRRLLEP